MDELVAEFLVETNEALEEVDSCLITLETTPNDQDLLSKIFRVLHTIKGTCGFLGLPRLEKVAHKAEDVLDLFRKGSAEVTPASISLILESIDRIKYIICEIEFNDAEPDGDDADLLAKLEAILGGDSIEATAPATSNEAAEPEVEKIATPVVNGQDIALNASPGDDANEDTDTKTEAKESVLSGQSLRVSVDVLENLMTMVSELVLTRNQLLQIMRTMGDNEFSAPLHRLNQVVSDLQDGVMKTRMQPIGNAWAKLPRIVRDISIDLGKKIELKMQGAETELDKQVLDLIRDPLTHMVRNSADHGIEGPQDRLAAGKPETGTIRLNSYHEGGHIIIDMEDDGRGLNTAKITEKVLNNGLATQEELDNMSEAQIHQFIFKAGFSTAENITSVSGRGVGMDVVRENIEKIGGSIELKSREGMGTRFTIKIPLTLAIVSALIIEAAEEKFAIPQLAVKELVKASTDEGHRIETIKGAPVFRLRDSLLPLISLRQLIGMGEEFTDIANDKAEANETENKKLESKGDYIVVIQIGNFTFGLIVDKVFDTEEIVIKPVSKMLANIGIFSGNTILGDGTVIMILDPAGIANECAAPEMGEHKDAAEDLVAAEQGEKTPVLLFSAGNDTPRAVPLELISRLEKINTSDIEQADGRNVIQYRGTLMPLIPFNADTDMADNVTKPVLVFTDRGQHMGLVVDKIIDITEEFINVEFSTGRDHIIGSCVINGKATDVINVAHFLEGANSSWFKDDSNMTFEEQKAAAQGSALPRILLVEDSSFFRTMITPILKVAGYSVTQAENAIDALELCEKDGAFDIIISDIEMPEMDGIEFAETVRSNDNWKHIPLVALTSHATPQDIDRGLQAGFNQYVAKFDRDRILEAINQTLASIQVAAL